MAELKDFCTPTTHLDDQLFDVILNLFACVASVLY